MTRKLFDYNEDITKPNMFKEKPSRMDQLKQKMSPKRLASMIMIDFKRACNEHMDYEELKSKYELTYDKIICFRYSDLELAPFFFTQTAGKMYLVKDAEQYHILVTSDLNTILNILKGNISVAKARRDGNITIQGDKIAHDEAMFFEIFQTVSPHLRKKLNMKVH
jgi:hypothetical protein